MSVQAILPATLPTPAQARNNLRACRNEVKEKTNVAEGMKDRLDAAKEEGEMAAAEVEQAERDLLEAGEDSKEEKEASAAHHKAWKRAERAQLDVGKVKATLKLARGEARQATSDSPLLAKTWKQYARGGGKSDRLPQGRDR